MDCYLIRVTLIPCELRDLRGAGVPYVAVMTREEWSEHRDSFDMGIDIEVDTASIGETQALVNWDSLTGTLSIPDREDISGPRTALAFALDEKGVVLIDGSGRASDCVRKLSGTKKWRLPSLERFLYDCLEFVICRDLRLLEGMEARLNALEEDILNQRVRAYPAALNDIRGDLLDLRVHYEQLIDLGQELEENGVLGQGFKGHC